MSKNCDNVTSITPKGIEKAPRVAGALQTTVANHGLELYTGCEVMSTCAVNDAQETRRPRKNRASICRHAGDGMEVSVAKPNIRYLSMGATKRNTSDIVYYVSACCDFFFFLTKELDDNCFDKRSVPVFKP